MQHSKPDPLGLVAKFGQKIEIPPQHQSIHLRGLGISIYLVSHTVYFLN